MRIVLATGIYPPEIGGPATFTKALAGELLARGHDVRVIAYGDGATDRALGIETVVPRAGGPLVRYIRYFFAVWKVAAGAEAVFAQGPVSEGVPSCLAAAVRGKPFVLKVVGDVAWESAQRDGYARTLDAFLRERANGKAGLLRLLERWVARRAAVVVTPSEYLRSVVRRWGVSRERTAVILNAVKLHAPAEAPDALRARHGLAGRRVLLAGGRLVPWKRIDHLLAVLGGLPREAVLVVAGDGPMRAAWEASAERSGVADRVRWLGVCPAAEMASWYAAADAFLLPSLYEGLPHMVIEAALHGLPSVVSDLAGNPETKTLFPGLVEVAAWDDVAAWHAAIGRALERGRSVPPDPGGLTRQGMIDAYEALLQEVAASTEKLKEA